MMLAKWALALVAEIQNARALSGVTKVRVLFMRGQDGGRVGEGKGRAVRSIAIESNLSYGSVMRRCAAAGAQRDGHGSWGDRSS